MQALSLIAKQSIPNMISKKGESVAVRKFGGGHSVMAHIGNKRLKVVDTIIWVNVMNREGDIMRVAAYPGESLMHALTRNNVPGHYPTCEGGDTEFPPWLLPVDYYSFGP